MKNTTILTLFIGIGTAISQNMPISGGNNFSAAVAENHKIYIWGANNVGQLALDATGSAVTDAYRNIPMEVDLGNISISQTSTIGLLPQMKKIDAGTGMHALALSCHKQLWAWGDNTEGQLGRAQPANAVPSRVLSGQQDIAKNNTSADPNNIYLDDISSFSAGASSSYAVEEATGFVLAWGDNAYGQLGDGTVTDRTSPVYVLKEDGTRLSNIIHIEAGMRNGYALDTRGNVWSWGHVEGIYQLGRSTTAIMPAATTGNCAPRAERVTTVTDPLIASTTSCSSNLLSNIVQISAGATHCLALDNNGNVWSFGGDWALGQLGRGAEAVFINCAGRVVAPGVTKTSGWIESDFLGNGIDGKAVHISAGVASSAVVLANGKVVTFGGRGIFTVGPTPTATGSINCSSTGNTTTSCGVLGDGLGTCNATSCETSGSANNSSKTPVYVKGIPTDENIVQVSDGDAWYFALSSKGKVFVWGWNRRGELGTGDYTDKCQAVNMVLPTGMTLAFPCPEGPKLGPDVNVCPIGISQVLNSGIKTPSTSVFKWYYTSNLSEGKTLISGAKSTSYTATKTGFYIVEVSDSRVSVTSECGPCMTKYDTVMVREERSKFVTSTSCYDNVAQLGYFATISAAYPKIKIKWYEAYTGGMALNPDDDLASITVSAQQQTVCNGMPGLFAEDITKYEGAIAYTGAVSPTVSQVASTMGCTQNSWYNTEGSSTQLMIEVTRTITLKSISILINAPNQLTGTNNLVIYTNNPTANFCNNCNPPKNTDGKSNIVFASIPFNPNYRSTNTYQITPISMDVTLPPGKYWITGDLQFFTAFNCNRTLQSNSHLWQIPFTDSGEALKAVTAYKFGSYSSSGAFFDIKYEIGTSYPCPRIPVCAATTCVITDVADTQLTQNLSLSPNPSKGSFTISLPSGTSQASMSIYDNLGHLVHENGLHAQATDLTLSHLKTGVYVVKVRTQNGTAVTRLVIE